MRNRKAALKVVADLIETLGDSTFELQTFPATLAGELVKRGIDTSSLAPLEYHALFVAMGMTTDSAASACEEVASWGVTDGELASHYQLAANPERK